MADYISEYTGKQIDNAISRANSLNIVNVYTDVSENSPVAHSIIVENQKYSLPTTKPIYKNRIWYKFTKQIETTIYMVDVQFELIANINDYNNFEEIVGHIFENNWLEHDVDVKYSAFVNCYKRPVGSTPEDYTEINVDHYSMIVGKNNDSNEYFLSFNVFNDDITRIDCYGTDTSSRTGRYYEFERT